MISHLDHIVLTVKDVDKSVDFFSKTLGMTPITYAKNRKAVAFGNQKINFNVVGQEVRNHAMEGSGDLCLIASVSLEKMQAHLANLHIIILEGPITKIGAQGEMQSIYINDLDNNLIEISFYPEPAKAKKAATPKARTKRATPKNSKT